MNKENNTFTVVARVATDISMHTTQSGKKVCNFSICERIKTEDERLMPVFMQAKAWQGVAEAIKKRLHKGDLVKFKVEPKNNSYTNGKGEEVEELIYQIKSFYFIKQSKRQERLARKNNKTVALVPCKNPTMQTASVN